MRPTKTSDDFTCIICDLWPYLLALLLLILALIFTRQYWMPAIGLGNQPAPLPTAEIFPTAPAAATQPPAASTPTGQPAAPTTGPTPAPTATPSPSISATPEPSITPTLVMTVAPEIGARAPDFTLEDTNGQQVSLADYRGKPVLLVFYASWCSYCKSNAASVEQYFEKYNPDDLQVLAVNITYNDSKAEAIQFATNYQWKFPNLLDVSRTVTSAYRQNGVPSYFFIDRNGVISFINIGTIGAENMQREIEKIL